MRKKLSLTQRKRFCVSILVVACLVFAIPGFADHKGKPHGKPDGGGGGGGGSSIPVTVTFRDSDSMPLDLIRSDFGSLDGGITYFDGEQGVKAVIFVDKFGGGQFTLATDESVREVRLNFGLDLSWSGPESTECTNLINPDCLTVAKFITLNDMDRGGRWPGPDKWRPGPARDAGRQQGLHGLHHTLSL